MFDPLIPVALVTLLTAFGCNQRNADSSSDASDTGSAPANSGGALSAVTPTDASRTGDDVATTSGATPAAAVSTSTESSRPEPHILLTGLAIGESPRWHAGHLWLCNWGTQEIVAVDLEGKSEVMARVPTTIPFSIDWLPDGRLLVVSGPEALLLRQEPDGSLVIHADLNSLAGGLNEIVVDGRGNVYVNGSVRDIRGGGETQPQEPGRSVEIDDTSLRRLEETKPGIIVLVTPDGSVRQVADGITFPNGMVITPDNSTLIIADSFESLTAFDVDADGGLSNRRVWAEVRSDGICLDAEGAVWAPSENGCLRVDRNGKVLQRINLDRSCFACMLGGEDGKTLFMLTADWRMTEGFTDNIIRLTTGVRTGQVVTARAPASRVGWP